MHSLFFRTFCCTLAVSLCTARSSHFARFITEEDELQYVPTGRSLLASKEPQISLANHTQPLSALNIPDTIESSVACVPAELGIAPELILCTYRNLIVWKGGYHFISKTPASHQWALTKLSKEGAAVHSEFAALGATPETAGAKVKLAALITPQQYSNFYSVVGLTLPSVFGVLCKHMDKCAYDRANLPQILLANPETVRESDNARPIRGDWTSCLSGTPAIQHNATVLADKLILLDTAVMLFNPSCSNEGAAGCAPWAYTKPASKETIYAPWREYLGSCLGFNTASHGPKGKVNILIVDRDYWLGRSILNIHEMQRLVKEKYPQANLTVYYPERWSLAEQAATYGNSHVIIWVTGASMTNMMFAPHGAVALHMGLRENPSTPYDWTAAWVENTVPHNIEMRHIRTRNPDRVILRSYMVYKNPQYEALTDDEKLAVWEVKICPGKEGDAVNTLCEEVWMAKGGEYEMEFGFLWEQMDEFMPRVLEAVGTA